jgi:hypothetical protein
MGTNAREVSWTALDEPMLSYLLSIDMDKGARDVSRTVQTMIRMCES